MFTLLAQANLQAAKQDKSISPGCFTMYISDAGDGAGRPHGMDVQTAGFPFPAADGAISKLLDDHFGPGKSRMVQFATARSEPTDEFHKVQTNARGNRSILQGFLKVGSNFLPLGTPLPGRLPACGVAPKIPL
jgi:hypothetical protein